MLVCYFILFALLLVVLETTLFMPSVVWTLSPDFHYILVAYLAYRFDILRGLIIIFPLCCALDVLSGTVFGMYALFCYTGYFLLRFLSMKLPFAESFYQIPLIGISYLFVSLVVYALLLSFDNVMVTPWSWSNIFAHTLLVMLLTYPFFLFFDLLRKYTTRSLLPWNKLRLRSDNRHRQPIHSDS